MELNLVIAQLKTWAPSFGGRVAGAAEFKEVPDSVAMPVPCAFVMPLADNPGPSESVNVVRQMLVESFSVVVALSNVADERGQVPATSLHAVRAELWASLLGWRPTADYNGITYEGGSLLAIDRARMWYQFEFGAPMQIGPEDGWEEGYLERLGPLKTVHINLDAIDPMADKNIKYPGPDGRIEHQSHLSNLDT